MPWSTPSDGPTGLRGNDSDWRRRGRYFSDVFTEVNLVLSCGPMA
jgi:hypothetical protein